MDWVSEAPPGDALARLRFHPREPLLASVGCVLDDVRVWRFDQAGTIECVDRIPPAGASPVCDVAWHPFEPMLAVVGGGRAIDLWHAGRANRTLGRRPTTGRIREHRYGITQPGKPMQIEIVRREIPRDEQGYSAVLFSRDGTRLVASRFGEAPDYGDPTEVYDVATGEIVSRFWTTDTALVRHPEGEIVATLTSDQGATAVRFGTLTDRFQGYDAQLLLEADGYDGLQFSPTGDAFAVVGNAYEIGIWAFSFPSCARILHASFETWEETRKRMPPELVARRGVLDRMAFAAGGKTILFGALDGCLNEIDLESAAVVRSWTVHPGPILALDVCEWSPLVATSAVDGRIRLWRHDARTSRNQHTRKFTEAFCSAHKTTEGLGDEDRFHTTDGQRWYDLATIGDTDLDDDAPPWAQIAHWQARASKRGKSSGDDREG